MAVNIFTIREAGKNAKTSTEVEIDEWGPVRLNRLSTPQFVQFAEAMQNAGSGSAATFEALYSLVCETAVDDAGALLFVEPADKELLHDNAAIVMKLGTAALELNGLSGEPPEKKSVASVTPPSPSPLLSGEPM